MCRISITAMVMFLLMALVAPWPVLSLEYYALAPQTLFQQRQTQEVDETGESDKDNVLSTREEEVSAHTMAKRVRVSGVAQREGKKYLQFVRTQDGKPFAGEVEVKNVRDAKFMEAFAELILRVKPRHQPVVRSFFTLIEKLSPQLCVSSQRVEDFFGWASSRHKLIVIDQSLVQDPAIFKDFGAIGLFHETGEYLLGDAPGGEFIGLDLKIIIGGRIRFGASMTKWLGRLGLAGWLKDKGWLRAMLILRDKTENNKEIDALTLTEESLAIALKDPSNPHYLLRAAQREIFADADRDLTRFIIREQNRDLLTDILQLAGLEENTKAKEALEQWIGLKICTRENREKVLSLFKSVHRCAQDREDTTFAALKSLAKTIKEQRLTQLVLDLDLLNLVSENAGPDASLVFRSLETLAMAMGSTGKLDDAILNLDLLKTVASAMKRRANFGYAGLIDLAQEVQREDFFSPGTGHGELRAVLLNIPFLIRVLEKAGDVADRVFDVLIALATKDFVRAGDLNRLELLLALALQKGNADRTFQALKSLVDQTRKTKLGPALVDLKFLSSIVENAGENAAFVFAAIQFLCRSEAFDTYPAGKIGDLILKIVRADKIQAANAVYALAFIGEAAKETPGDIRRLEELFAAVGTSPNRGRVYLTLKKLAQAAARNKGGGAALRADFLTGISRSARGAAYPIYRVLSSLVSAGLVNADTFGAIETACVAMAQDEQGLCRLKCSRLQTLLEQNVIREDNLARVQEIGTASYAELADLGRGRGVHPPGPAGPPSTFERFFTAPLLDQDRLAGDELKFVFKLFGRIDLTFVPQSELPEGGAVIRKVDDDSGRVRSIVCSDQFAPEQLIELMGVLCSEYPAGRERLLPVAFRLHRHFAQMGTILSEAAARQDVSAPMQIELGQAGKYCERLAEKTDRTFGLAGAAADQVETSEGGGRLRNFVERTAARVDAKDPARRRAWLDRLGRLAGRQLARHLTDQFDAVLLEGIFDQFRRLAESWDVPHDRGEVLCDVLEEEGAERFGNWLASARARYQRAQGEHGGNPEKMGEIDVAFAKETGKIITEQFPNYSSGKFHLGDIADATKANCVGYATMFCLAARDIGLDARMTSVEYGDDERIHHAANLLYLPAVSGIPRFVVVDVTWDNYISSPIGEENVAVQHEGGVQRRIKIPEALSRHAVVVEFRDVLEGVRYSLYGWSSSSDDYLKNSELKRRVAEKVLRLYPNDPAEMRILGQYFARGEKRSDGPRDSQRATEYLRRSLRMEIEDSALDTLNDLYSRRGQQNKFYDFCDELLDRHDMPQDITTVARHVKPAGLGEDNPPCIERRIAILENGLTRFPENTDMMRKLSSEYEGLYGRLKDTDKKRAAYERALGYAEKSLRIDPDDFDFLRDMMWLNKKEDPSAGRFVEFCRALAHDNPHMAGPVCALIFYHENLSTKSGYREAVRLAKEYLERPESKGRKHVFWFLNAIYTDPEGRKGNIYLGKIDELLAFARSLHDKFQTYETLWCLSKTLADAGRYAEAIPLMKRYTNRYPDPVRLYALLECQKNIGDWEGVLETAGKIFDEDEDELFALQDAGIACQKLGRYGEAVRMFERYMALHPPDHTDPGIEQRIILCRKKMQATTKRSTPGFDPREGEAFQRAL